MSRDSRIGWSFIVAALSLQATSGAHAACGTTAAAAAGVSTIQNAVDSAPAQLTAGDHCVSIESGTYGEQVAVRNIDANGFRIVIAAAPGASVTVSPPAGSQAAFLIDSDSVTLAGLSIRTEHPMPYGVLAASGFVAISSVNVFSHEGNIASAGIVLGSHGRVSTTYVGVRLAHALSLPGSLGASVSFSIFETSGSAVQALHLAGASGNRLTGLLASNRGGHCVLLTGQSSSNTIELSTFTGGLGGHGLYLDGGSGNSIQRSVLAGGSNIDYGDGGRGLGIKGSVSNLVERSILTGGKGGFAGSGGSGAALEASGDFNTISFSTLTGGMGGLHPAGYASSGGHGLLIANSRSNTVSQSVLRGSEGGHCKGGGGGPGGHGLSITQGTSNAVTLSELAGGLGGGGGVYNGGFGGHGASLSAGTLNAIRQSRLYGGPGNYGKGQPGQIPGEGGHGFHASGGGSNIVERSLMAGAVGGTGDAVMGGGGGGGLTLKASASNTIDQSVMTGGLGGGSWSSGAYGADGHGAGLLADANSNTISASTITSAGRGLNIDAASSNVVTGANVRGSTAAVISASAGTAVRSSVLEAAVPFGSGVWLKGGSSGLTLSADSVTGGSQAAGILIESGSSGALSLNSTSIQGARTGIAFLGGTVAATLAGMVFPDAGAAVNVDASLLTPSSRIIMTDAQGPRAGPAFENDPRGLVDWLVSGVPPGQPGLPASAVLGASSITWTWSAAANATGYRVFQADNPEALIASVGPAAFLQAGLPPNTAHGIVVAGVNGSLLGPLSAAGTAHTLAAPPAGLALAQVRASSITMGWSANGNPAGTRYRAQLWTAGGATATLTSTALTAAFTGLSPLTKYDLGLEALNADGVASPAGSVLSATTLPEPPAAPAGLAGATLGVSSISWTWDAVSSATSYRLFKAADPATLVASVAATSFVATGLAANTAYGVAAAGVNAGGPGPLSTAATAHTLAAPPSGLALIRVHSSSAALSWGANTNPAGITSYRVDLWQASGATTTVTVLTTSAAVSGLSGGSTYYLTVSAINALGLATPCGEVLTAVTAPGAGAAGKVDGDGGTVAFDAPAGRVLVIIPPGAFARTTNLRLSLPAGFPPPASAVLTVAGTGVGVQITADQPVQPGADVQVSVSYRPFDLSGLGAGILSLARYDEDRKVWVPLISDVDEARRTVSGRTRHFSLFQIMQTVPASTVDLAKAFPNPFRPAQGHTTMMFANLPAGARVRIYDFSGALVRDLTANAAGLASWDGANQSGKKAASGVYFVFAQGAGGRKTFKAAIQR